MTQYFETHPDSNKVLIFFIRGLGGFGKTQLALKYAEQAGTRYQKKYFIDCHSKEKFEDSLRALAMQLGVDPIGKSTSSLISELVSELNLTPNGLIIIDNVDSQDMFESMTALLPEKNNHVIITGRYCPKLPHIKDYPMPPFSLEESKELVKKLLNDYPELVSNEIELEDFVKQLKCFPLSIKQAVSLIRKLNGEMSLREYIDLYIKEDTEEMELLLDTVGPDRDYVKTVAQTYLPTINEIAKHNPLARELLYLYAYFGGSGEFPTMFFENDAAYRLLMPKDSKVTRKTAAQRIQIANNLLADFSLIDYRKNSRNEKVLEIHETLRKAIRLHNHEKKEDYFKKAVELFNRGTNELYISANKAHVSAIFREYVIQFSEFIEMAKTIKMEQQTIVDLLSYSPLLFKTPVEFSSPTIQNLQYVHTEDLRRFHDLRISQQYKLVADQYEQLDSQARAEFDSALKSREISFTKLLDEFKQSLKGEASLNIGIVYLAKGDINQAETIFNNLVHSESLLTRVQALNNLHIISLLNGNGHNHRYLDQAKSLIDQIKTEIKKGRYDGLIGVEPTRKVLEKGVKTGGTIGVYTGTAVGGLLFLGGLFSAPFLPLLGAAFGAGLLSGTLVGSASGIFMGITSLFDKSVFFDPEKLSQIRDQIEQRVNYLEDVIETNRNTKVLSKSKL